MRRSEIVKALADIASQGRYTVDPSGARKMNTVFVLVADLINALEREERVPADATEQNKESVSE